MIFFRLKMRTYKCSISISKKIDNRNDTAIPRMRQISFVKKSFLGNFFLEENIAKTADKKNLEFKAVKENENLNSKLNFEL